MASSARAVSAMPSHTAAAQASPWPRLVYRALQDCRRRQDAGACRRIYCFIAQLRWESVAPLADHIIRTFLSSSSSAADSRDACKVFRYVPNPTVYTWTALISLHVELRDLAMSLHLYQAMQASPRLQPDRVLLLCVLGACSSMGASEFGRLLHHQVVERGFDADVVVGNTLVDMYAKCGDLDGAIVSFHGLSHRSLVSWSALIAGFALHGYGEDAFDCFAAMQDEGFAPCKDMFLCMLKVCSSSEAGLDSMEMHDQVIRHGHETDVRIGSSLVDSYSKCHCLEAADKVFDAMPTRNVVTWGSLITGYAQHGYGFMALELFERMQKEGIRPGAFLLSSMLKVCATVGASKQGRLLYETASRESKADIAVANALVDMYCKCGDMDMAHRVLNEMPIKDLASWGALVAGYASQGGCKQALECLECMVKEGLKPDGGIFMNILVACSHVGLREEGWYCFEAMIKDHKVTPTVEHYNCLIDLLGRAGHLNEASDLLCTMSSTPDVIGRRSLLTGCRTFKNSIS